MMCAGRLRSKPEFCYFWMVLFTKKRQTNLLWLPISSRCCATKPLMTA